MLAALLENFRTKNQGHWKFFFYYYYYSSEIPRLLFNKPLGIPNSIDARLLETPCPHPFPLFVCPPPSPLFVFFLEYPNYVREGTQDKLEIYLITIYKSYILQWKVKVLGKSS